MSDTVTIHNGHCSYHGPADKAPVWAARVAINDLHPPAPTIPMQIVPGPMPAQRVPDGASIASEFSGVGAHESHATRNEKALVLERKLSAPGSVHTHDQPMVEGAPSQVRKSLPKVSDVPAPETSFEDTTHAWEEGYRAGMAFSASGRATGGEGLHFGMDGTQKGKIPVSEANSGPIGKEIW